MRLPCPQPESRTKRALSRAQHLSKAALRPTGPGKTRMKQSNRTSPEPCFFPPANRTLPQPTRRSASALLPHYDTSLLRSNDSSLRPWRRGTRVNAELMAAWNSWRHGTERVPRPREAEPPATKMREVACECCFRRTRKNCVKKERRPLDKLFRYDNLTIMKTTITLLILGLGALALSSCSERALRNAGAAAAGTAIRGGTSEQATDNAVRAAIRTDMAPNRRY